MTRIVSVLVSQQIAPTPETLQQTGALVSQGGTILSPGASALLTQLSDLTPLLRGALALSGLVWSGGTVTASTSAPHGFTVGDTVELTIAGAAPSGYNGTYQCLITGASTFTYPLAANPGSETTPGTYTPEDVAELLAMATTFFAQGNSTAVYVLEFGPGTPNEGIAALSAYLTANPNTSYTPGASGFYYVYEVPREWDGNANFLALVASYESTTARTYFQVTTTLANYGLYTPLMKCVIALIEAPAMDVWAQNALLSISWSGGVVTAATTTAHNVDPGEWFQIQGCVPVGYNGWHQAQPGTTGSTLVYNLAANPGTETTLGVLEANIATSAGVPSTEFSSSAFMWNILHQQPSSTNKVTPFAFDYVFGVTPFPQQGLSALLTTLQQAAVNTIQTGAEGGISNACLFWGTSSDGQDFLYWYSVDWMAITADVNLANTVINGSNNPLNPLYYNQPGINRLQDAVVATANSAVNVGLGNGTVVMTSLTGPQFTEALDNGQFDGQIVVNAVPYLPYLTVNPGDYKLGRYAGLSVQFIPSRGFVAIVLNLNVTELVVGL